MLLLHAAASLRALAASAGFLLQNIDAQRQQGRRPWGQPMMAPPGRPGGVEVGYSPRTPAQARVCTAPGDVPAPCPRSPRGYRSMVRVAICSAIHHFSLFHSRPVAIDTASPAC
jgi:hypothetical protein